MGKIEEIITEIKKLYQDAVEMIDENSNKRC